MSYAEARTRQLEVSVITRKGFLQQSPVMGQVGSEYLIFMALYVLIKCSVIFTSSSIGSTDIKNYHA